MLEAGLQHGVFHMDELWRRLSPEDNTIAELQKIAQASTLKAWQKRHALSNTGPKPGQVSCLAPLL